jgi:hypothetical protein
VEETRRGEDGGHERGRHGGEQQREEHGLSFNKEWFTKWRESRKFTVWRYKQQHKKEHRLP